MIQAPFLNKGDLVLLVAPSGVVKDKNCVKLAQSLVESWGFEVSIGQHVFQKSGHFAGKDKLRIQDFQEGLDNPKVKAIWAIRGGYGALRIIDQLNFSGFKKQPKWLIGFSDFTVFHLHLQTMGFQSIHGSMPIQLKNKTQK